MDVKPMLPVTGMCGTLVLPQTKKEEEENVVDAASIFSAENIGRVSINNIDKIGIENIRKIGIENIGNIDVDNIGKMVETIGKIGVENIRKIGIENIGKIGIEISGKMIMENIRKVGIENTGRNDVVENNEKVGVESTRNIGAENIVESIRKVGIENMGKNGVENIGRVGFENVGKLHKKNKGSTKDGTRKSIREKKTPLHLANTVTERNCNVGETTQKKTTKTTAGNTSIQETSVLTKVITKKQQDPRQNVYPNFKCDNCGSRYVVNPMRRGNKISSPRYKATPRHKIDPDTQKILTLCNACGLKFGRQKKMKQCKEGISQDEQRRFLYEGEQFAKELSHKLNNEAASNLFCSNAKKSICGCVQKYICGEEGSTVDEIVFRAKDLLDIYLRSVELKKLKCYDPHIVDIKTGRKGPMKIGLGNGHRKSKEFEEFVLSKRSILRTTLKFCEKGAQKILSYSNNFLHKRMKTDPEKGIRIERQKGKAALGMLNPIEDLMLEPCCVDNCVRMSLTHGRLLEVWRERATSSQVEARRVLAEMLTPSGGNRANCYRFVSWVTGCSHSTIGKVNEQMKSTGGDREPPEHGLKKYWKENPKHKTTQTKFVPSYQILQTAANSAGLSTMIQESPNKTVEPEVKKMKRQPNKTQKGGSKKSKVTVTSNHETHLTSSLGIVGEGAGQAAGNHMHNMHATVIALNGGYPSAGFIQIPAGLTTGNTITIPNAVTLHTMQQQVAQQQQQQQLQLQIEMLQQQLQQNSQAVSQHNLPSVDENPEYVVAVPNDIEQNGTGVSVGTPVVVETVTTQNLVTQPYVPNVVTQSLVSIPSSVLPAGNISFVSSGDNMGMLQNSEPVRNTQNISLLTPSVASAEELNMMTQNNAVVNAAVNAVITPQNTLAETSVIGMRASAPIESLTQVHLITSQSPTMALSQPMTFTSLHTPTISLSNLPTMLLTQPVSNEQRQPGQQQYIIQQASSTSEQLVFQRPLFSQPNTEHLVVQHATPTMHSSTEQTVAMTTSVLPPMTSFNADAFLTSNTSNGTMTYAVLNTGTQNLSHSVMDDQSRTIETSTIQMPFLPS